MYLDQTIWSSLSASCQFYSDVLALDTSQTTTMPKGGVVEAYTRNITATGPVTLNVQFSGADESELIIYASSLDQPVSLKTNSGGPTTIDLGVNGKGIAVQIDWKDGNARVSYIPKYALLESSSSELQKLVQTQLRIATILFWTKSGIASDIATHVGRVAANSSTGAIFALQANALSQQIAASQIGGPNISYAPVLTLQTSHDTLMGWIDVASTFEDQYIRFTDQKSSLQIQEDAWDTMLKHAEDILSQQKSQVMEAEGKWHSANQTMNTAANSLNLHQIDLKDAQMRFKVGIENWKEHTAVEAAVSILFAIASKLLVIFLPLLRIIIYALE